MKKLLLGTTAAVLAFSFGAVHAGAPAATTVVGKTPALVLSGQSTANVYFFKNTQRTPNDGKGNGHHIASEDTRLNAEVMGKADGYGGLEYGFLMGITGNTEKGKTSVEEARIKLKGEWGTLFIGNTRGVEDRMPVGAFSVMGGTGGIDGNYRHVVNESTGVVTRTDLGGGVNGAVGATKDGTKITYVTPRVNGVQAGVSFTPNTQHRGEGTLQTLNSRDTPAVPFDKNSVAMGLNYKDQFANGVSVELSFTGVMAQTQPGKASLGNTSTVTLTSYNQNLYQGAKRNNTKAYALGGVFGWKDWKLGLEFIDNTKSGEITALPGADAGKVFSIGGSYTYGVDTFSAGFLHSWRSLGVVYDGTVKHDMKAKANVYSIMYDRKFAPGLTGYIEFNAFDFNTDDYAARLQDALNTSEPKYAQGVKSNRGHVILSGVKVKF